MKDLIIKSWFDANAKNFPASPSFGDIFKAIEDIAEYYSSASAVVSKDQVLDYFKNKPIMYIYKIFKEYACDGIMQYPTPTATWDAISEDMSSSASNLHSPSKNASSGSVKIDPIVKSVIKHIKTYDEIKQLERKRKQFTKTNIVRDTHILGPEDYFTGTENTPENVEDYIVAHIPGNTDFNPVWYNLKGMPDMKEDRTMNRRLRNSFIKHYEYNGCDMLHLSPSNVSLCNGKLYVQRYMNK